jgi:hypothetical protein
VKLTFGGAIEIDITTTDRRYPRTSAQEAQHAADHVARQTLIHRPFPIIGGGRHLPCSYPWGGTIIGDTFFGGRDRPNEAKRGRGIQVDTGSYAGFVDNNTAADD